MAEKPINLSTKEVLAILGERETQLRRAVKWPLYSQSDGGKRRIFCERDANVVNQFMEEKRRPPCQRVKSPFGYPGDKLWVRESFVRYQTINHVRYPDGRSFAEVSDGCVAYRADGYGSIEDLRDHIRLMSGADLEGVEIESDRWRPSPQMPRWASRITLKVLSVRVECTNGVWGWACEVENG